MNKFTFILITFLFVFVSGGTFFKKVSHRSLYSDDVQCKLTKQLAYEGEAYKSVYFTLQSFLLELKTKNCLKSFEFECSQRNFDLSQYTSLLYDYHCDKARFFKLCSQYFSHLTKTKHLVNLKSTESYNCLSIIHVNSDNYSNVNLFSEFRTSGFFSNEWNLRYNNSERVFGR